MVFLIMASLDYKNIIILPERWGNKGKIGFVCLQITQHFRLVEASHSAEDCCAAPVMFKESVCLQTVM